MGVMEPLVVPYDGWTVDDLPDTELRCELVDGGLLVTPPPELRHDEAAMALRDLLRDATPSALRVLTAAGVHFDRRNYRLPDVLAYDRAASARGRIEPQDLLLAVEVMSSSSLSTDRVTKPAQYAAAGIPHFWRLELDPLVLVIHRLVGAAYEETARFSDDVVVTEPVELAFHLAGLLD